MKPLDYLLLAALALALVLTANGCATTLDTCMRGLAVGDRIDVFEDGVRTSCERSALYEDEE